MLLLILLLILKAATAMEILKKFVDGVETLLKPDGLFVIADFRQAGEEI